MEANRRTLLKAIGGAATVTLAGCTGSGDGDGSQGGETEADEWSEVDLTSDVQYNFPEGERITYESDQPAEVQDLSAYIRGDVLEIRGTLTVTEQIRQIVEIQAEFQQDGESFGQADTSIERPGPGEEHSFTITSRSSEVNSITGFTLTVNGPEPQV
jgi:hypothetical protein